MLVKRPFISDSRPIFVHHVISTTNIFSLCQNHNYDVIYDILWRHKKPKKRPPKPIFSSSVLWWFYNLNVCKNIEILQSNSSGHSWIHSVLYYFLLLPKHSQWMHQHGMKTKMLPFGDLWWLPISLYNTAEHL